MKHKVFIDTNIWIYALTESKLEADKGKREISFKLFEGLIENENSICISIQVINECHWNFIRRFNIQDTRTVGIA